MSKPENEGPESEEARPIVGTVLLGGLGGVLIAAVLGVVSVFLIPPGPHGGDFGGPSGGSNPLAGGFLAVDAALRGALCAVPGGLVGLLVGLLYAFRRRG
jgi:hypothetical protein